MSLFEDNFSVDLSKWIVVSESWGIVDGQLKVYARNGPALIKTYVGDTWTNYSVEMLIAILGETYREVGFAFRMLDNNNYYRLVAGTEGAGQDQIRRIYLHKVVNGVITEISPYLNVEYACPLTLKVEVLDEAEGTRINVYVNGMLRYSWLDEAKTFTAGRAGIITDQYAAVNIDNFFVRLLAPPGAHFLSVNTTPITNVPFTIGGENMKTPWTGSLSEGTYAVIMPYEVQAADGIYRFVQWEDGSTELTRTIGLLADMTITATYEYVAPPPKPCFVATACYGSPITKELNVLRRFRDRCLPNEVVYTYYKVGVYLAQFMEGRKRIKRYVREVLNLFIKLYKGVME